MSIVWTLFRALCSSVVKMEVITNQVSLDRAVHLGYTDYADRFPFAIAQQGAEMSLDTHPDARRVQIELMRRAPVWRKMELLGQLNAMAKLFALSGLRSRYPHASEAEIRRRLADLILGEELAAKVYGPLEESLDAE